MERVNTIINSYSLSLSPDINPANVTIYPHETSDGYFWTNATLLRGVTGVVVQVINANGSMQFEQRINRSGSVRSTIRLPRGNYTVKVYQKMNSGTFNVSRPIKTGILLQCIMEEDTTITPTSTTPIATASITNNKNNTNNGRTHNEKFPSQFTNPLTY